MKQLIKRGEKHINIVDIINQKGDLQFFSMIYKNVNGKAIKK